MSFGGWIKHAERFLIQFLDESSWSSSLEDLLCPTEQVQDVAPAKAGQGILVTPEGGMAEDAPESDSKPAKGMWSVSMFGESFFKDRDSRWRAAALSLCVAFLSLVQSGQALAYSEIQGTYMNALVEKNAKDFWVGVGQTVDFIIVAVIVTSSRGFMQTAMQIEFSSKMNRKITKEYLDGNNERPAFYSMKTDDAEVENPDQTINQDIAALSGSLTDLVFETGTSALSILMFTLVLYKVSAFAAFFTIAYVVVTSMAASLGFAPWTFKYSQEATEIDGSMRYSLVRIRENAESIAFFRGGHSEWLRYEEMLSKYVRVQYFANVVHALSAAFNTGVEYTSYVIPALLVGPAYLRGEARFGSLTQAEYAFSTINASMMALVAKIDEFASISAQIQRLKDLEAALVQSEPPPLDPQETSSGMSNWNEHETIEMKELQAWDPDVLALRAVTLRTPVQSGAIQRTLVQDLTFQLHCGESSLIVGRSGIGKSSLLRGIAGLWVSGKGTVACCRGDAVFFMPQRPYMYVGCLREQLLYPDVERTDIPPGSLVDVLREVNLGYIGERYSLEETQDWSNILSLGEQQRVNFARMLLRPSLRLALIDEGTSACDPANEAHLYNLLKRQNRSFVSVGHRPALRQYHSNVLWLQDAQASAADKKLGSKEVSSSPACARFLTMKEYEEKMGPEDK